MFEAIKGLMGRRVDPFTEWCQQELFTSDMVKAAELLEKTCDLHLFSIYRMLDLENILNEPKTAREVTNELRLVDSADVTVEAVLWRLAHNSDVVELVENADGEDRYVSRGPAPDPSADLALKWAQLSTLGDEYLAARKFVDFGATHFVEALRDDPDLMDRVLSGREPRLAELWDQATNLDPLQDIHGKMGARVILHEFQGGDILEIGGGTGNGIRHVLDTLAEGNALDRVNHYLFTDISTAFVLNTRRAIRKAYPDIKSDWRYLDINKEFASQKIERESADLIYGVNAAHVAKDIVEMLKECHATLRSGGQVIFSERIRLDSRMMAPRELSLNLSIYHRTAAVRNADYRPVHCYLTPANWERVLDMAGFNDVVICPDLDTVGETFPHQYAAVVVAKKA